MSNPLRTKIQVGKLSRTENISSVASSQENAQSLLNIDPDSIFAQKSLYDLCDTNFTKKYGGKKKRKSHDEGGVSYDQANVTKGTNKSSSSTSSSTKELETITSTGPMVEIVNGKIVVKQSSLVLNPTNPLMYDDYEEVVEDNYPTATYSSFLKRQPSPAWNVEETRLFYQAVRQCGLEFTMMQIAFFPSRTRKQLKAKFYREEKSQPDLIKRALNTSLPLELSLFDDAQGVAGTNIHFTGAFDPKGSGSMITEDTESVSPQVVANAASVDDVGNQDDNSTKDKEEPSKKKALKPKRGGKM